MSRLVGFAFAACLLAAGTSTGLHAESRDWPKSLMLASASPGSTYFFYGEALTRILTEKLGIAVNPIPTQGTVHNARLVDGGGAQLGMLTMGVALESWNGTGDWAQGKQMRNMRALFPMFDTPLQSMVLRRSGITAFAQFDGKRIGVGPKASTGGTFIPVILKSLGISAAISNGSHELMATELLAGDIDGYVTLQGAPVPAVQEAEVKEPLTFISLSPEQMTSIRKTRAEFSPSTIPGGTYRALEKDYDTVGVYNFAVGRADLADDLVYQIVKVVFDNQPQLLKAQSAARETIPQNAVKNTFLPFHPGAARYYREIGINLPDPLVGN